MEVNQELIKKVATVARLKLTGNEINRFVPQLKEILEYFSELSKVDTTNVKPSFHPIEIKNKLREDVAKEPITQKDALKNSKYNQEGYFKGPKAV
jgi:aspartyl-tRNA(Asn)/glutamyl-tRNA(Gln) amidotransferase subunit C